MPPKKYSKTKEKIKYPKYFKIFGRKYSWFFCEWIEELFPHKNKTKCLASDWYVPFDKYLTIDKDDFLIGDHR